MYHLGKNQKFFKEVRAQMNFFFLDKWYAFGPIFQKCVLQTEIRSNKCNLKGYKSENEEGKIEGKSVCFMIGTYVSFVKINVLIHFIEIFLQHQTYG